MASATQADTDAKENIDEEPLDVVRHGRVCLLSLGCTVCSSYCRSVRYFDRLDSTLCHLLRRTSSMRRCGSSSRGGELISVELYDTLTLCLPLCFA